MAFFPCRFAPVLGLLILFLATGWQCTHSPQEDATAEASSSPNSTALDTLLAGSVLIDSTEAALRRFEERASPTVADSAALRRWTTQLRAAGDSLEAQAPDSARLLLEKGLVASRALADSARIAEYLNDIGTTHYVQSRFDRTLRYWRQSLAISRDLDDPEGISTSLNNIAIIHARQGRYDKALDRYREALELARKHDDRDGIASALNNIGLLYQNQGRYREALPRYRKSLAIEREQSDLGGIASSLNNLGLIHQSQGRYEKALDRYQQSLAIERERGDKSGIASTLNNVGIIYKNLGRYDKALARYRESLAIKRELGDRGGRADALANVGFLEFRQGRYAEALAHFRESLSIERSLEDKDGVAQTLSTIGNVREEQGRLEEALSRYQEALSILRQIGDRSGIATGLKNVGDVYRRQGRYEDALGSLRRSLSIRREIGERAHEASTLNAIGKVRARQRRYDSALSRYRTALRINRETGRRPDLAQNLENVGLLYLARGELAKATDTLGRSVRLAETLRRNATEPEARRSLLSTQIGAYRALVAAHVQAGRPDSALHAAEQARARLLADRLASAAETDTTFSTPSPARLRRTLGPDETAVLYANAGTRWPLTALIVTSDTTHARPLPDSTVRASVGRAYADRLQQLRRTDGPLTAALNESRSASTNAVPSLAETIRLYRSSLTRLDGISPQGDSLQRDLARRLYGLLLEPTQDLLQDTNELTIVPTGALGYLPFEALVTPSGGYLIEATTVRYAQSLAVRRQLQARTYGSSRRPLLAIGGADYEGPAPDRTKPLLAGRRGDSTTATETQASTLFRSAKRRLDRGQSPRSTYAQLGYTQLPPLYGTRLEVRKLGRALGQEATLLTGSHATEERLRQMSASGRLSRYRRVHFATHGLVVPEAPELSALVLSQTRASDSLATQDGYLTMREIADLRLRADVAVLSACRTGLGRIVAGEGVVSLSHAFMQAGANATLVSQWRVLDWSTQQFMSSVYREARAGDTSFAEATARVKRAFIDGTFGARNTDPLRWAPFVYYGR